jgi:hypothetical protein
VARFVESDGAAADQTQVALFNAKLLWLLCDRTSGSNAAQVKAVLGTLDAEKFSSGDGAVNGVLRNLAKSLTI